MSSSPASTSSQIFAGGYVALQCQLKGRAFATTLFARAHAARAEDDRFPAQRTLFALNVPPRADADGLRAAFGRLGDVESVELGRLGGDAAAADDAGPRTAHVVFARAAALKKALRAARPVQLALAEAPAAAAAGGDGGEDREALQRSVDAFMRSFEADEGRRRRELEASHNRMDGDGFTLVTRQQKGTGRSTGDVSLSCASRLSYLAFNDKEGREALVCALEPIVRLMMRCTRRHWVEALPADPKVQAHCCSALGSISSGSTERSLSAVRAGGVKAIVNAMRSHPADREVQFQGAAAMYRIVHDDTAQGRERKLAAGIAGGVEAALAAMQGNPRDTELLRWGAMAFRSIARGDLETTGRAINAGAFEITEAAKAAHPNNASVQQHCDEALNLLRWARDRLPPAGV